MKYRILIFLSFLICLIIWPAILKADSTKSTASIYEANLSFVNETTTSVKLNQWKGSRLIIAFAYTSCRLTCPLVMRQLKRIDKLLNERSASHEILFITIDPRIDTSERLLRYKRDWKVTSEHWHFLTGDEKAIRKLATILKFDYTNIDEHIQHDKKVMDIDAAGFVQHTIASWDADLSNIL